MNSRMKSCQFQWLLIKQSFSAEGCSMRRVSTASEQIHTKGNKGHKEAVWLLGCVTMTTDRDCSPRIHPYSELMLLLSCFPSFSSSLAAVPVPVSVPIPISYSFSYSQFISPLLFSYLRSASQASHFHRLPLPPYLSSPPLLPPPPRFARAQATLKASFVNSKWNQSTRINILTQSIKLSAYRRQLLFSSPLPTKWAQSDESGVERKHQIGKKESE